MSQNNNIQILLVEDDAQLQKFLAEELEENGYEVLTTDHLHTGIELLSEHIPEIIISDIRLPDGRGDELLKWSQQFPLPPPVILITAFGQVDEAVSALRQGASDFLTKPIDVDHLLLRLQKTHELQSLRKEVTRLKSPHEVKSDQEPLKLGQSPVWRQIENQLPQIAKTNDPVLITGATGTGKEVVARAIHSLSPQKDFPFIPVNCSGLPENLLESELFGHVSGAFTGADKSRKGLFSSAEGGTILLDEIGEMPIEMQTKLLRALQEKKIRPLGSDREQPVNVRILAATNQVLENKINEGTFREDLFYRLETLHLNLPPLKDRPEDIDLFTSHFIAQSASDLDKEVSGISEKALEMIKEYPFPGNVRELKNIIRRAVVFCNSNTIEPSDLPEKMRSIPSGEFNTSFLPKSLITMEDMRRKYARHVLEKTNGNKNEAARLLGISRSTLYSLLS